jgi:hypothetical protein
MPRYRVKAPDGSTYVVNAPEGATPQQVLDYATQHHAQQGGGQQGSGFLHTLGNIAHRADDFVRGAADTLTLGTADEIAAGVGALTGIGGRRGDYQGNLAAQGQRDAQGGGARMAGQVAGALLLPSSKLASGPGLVGWGATAAEGAGYGGAYAAGSAQGGVQERAKAAIPGAVLGAVGGTAGRAAGTVASRVLSGPKVPAAVRTLADEGVTMTPGRRGGPVARTMEEGVLGSIPFVKTIPAAANRRSIEQMNVAAYNRVLKPIKQSLPMSTEPGHAAIGALGDTVYNAYDTAASNLGLRMDRGLTQAQQALSSAAPATVGQSAPQLQAILDSTLAPLQTGPIAGTSVRDLLQDLRGQASTFSTSSVANERNMGNQLWKLHDQIESAVARQNPADVLTPFKAARSAVSNLKRVEAAAAKSPDGVFNPQQFSTAVSKRGYGTTTANLARGSAPMQDLADAAKQVLPAQIPNSGTPERIAALTALAGGSVTHPYLGLPVAASLARYMPGVDTALQDFALNRPDFMVKGGDAMLRYAPYLGTAGALTAASQNR